MLDLAIGALAAILLALLTYEAIRTTQDVANRPGKHRKGDRR